MCVGSGTVPVGDTYLGLVLGALASIRASVWQAWLASCSPEVFPGAAGKLQVRGGGFALSGKSSVVPNLL